MSEREAVGGWRLLLRMFMLANGIAFTVLGFVTNNGILDELSILIGSFITGYVGASLFSGQAPRGGV